MSSVTKEACDANSCIPSRSRSPPERRAFFVMLEDLSPEYRMLDFESGLSPRQLRAALRDLARFHATCYAYGQLRKLDFRLGDRQIVKNALILIDVNTYYVCCTTREKYGHFLSSFFSNFEDDKDLADFMEHNMDLVEKDMQGSPAEHLLGHVKKLRRGIGKKYKEATKCEGYERFLMHGDIW